MNSNGQRCYLGRRQIFPYGYGPIHFPRVQWVPFGTWELPLDDPADKPFLGLEQQLDENIYDKGGFDGDIVMKKLIRPPNSQPWTDDPNHRTIPKKKPPTKRELAKEKKRKEIIKGLENGSINGKDQPQSPTLV